VAHFLHAAAAKIAKKFALGWPTNFSQLPFSFFIQSPFVVQNAQTVV